MKKPLLGDARTGAMEEAFEEFERASREALAALKTAWRTETDDLDRGRQSLETERTQLYDAVAAERNKVDADRAALVAEIAGMVDLRAQQEDRVLLSVGGTPFEASRRTLTAEPASFLGAMFSGRHELRVDPDGRVFIDRSGALFPYVLNFLRNHANGDEDAARPIRALGEAELEAVRREVNYFGLEDVVFPVVPFSVEEANFGPGPDMGTRRYGCAAVALSAGGGGDGRGSVLVIGGEDEDERDLSSTEVLDVAGSMTWSAGPAMASARSSCAAAVLEDGRVVVVGGWGNGDGLSTTEVLDAAGSAWSPGPQLVSRRCACAAVALGGNRVLVIGGRDDSSFLSTTEVVDLASGTSTPGPALALGRRYCAAVLLRDGRVLVVGGNDGSSRLSSTEVLDLTSGTSSPGPELASRRDGCAATVLRDGRVLVVGGKSDAITFLATTEVLDVTANTATPGPQLGTARSYCAAVSLPDDDRVLVIGGGDLGDDERTISHASTEVLSMPSEEAAPRRRKRRRVMQ